MTGIVDVQNLWEYYPVYVVFEKSDEKVYFSRYKETMSPHYLAMTLKIVIRLVTVSVSYLILHQQFYLIKIYNVGANSNVLRKLDF